MTRSAALAVALASRAWRLRRRPACGVRQAGADSSADEADARFRRGTELYKQRRYDEALLEFFSSNRLAPNRNVVFNIARSLEALGRYDEAYRYYSDFLAAAPPAEDRHAAEARLAELRRVCLLEVRSTPSGAHLRRRKDLAAAARRRWWWRCRPARTSSSSRAPASSRRSARDRRAGPKVDVDVVLEAIPQRAHRHPSPGELRVDRAEDDTGPPTSPPTRRPCACRPRHAVEVRAPVTAAAPLIVVEAKQEQTIEAALDTLPAPRAAWRSRPRERGARAHRRRRLRRPALVASVPVGAHRIRSTATLRAWCASSRCGATSHVRRGRAH